MSSKTGLSELNMCRLQGIGTCAKQAPSLGQGFDLAATAGERSLGRLAGSLTLRISTTPVMLRAIMVEREVEQAELMPQDA